MVDGFFDGSGCFVAPAELAEVGTGLEAHRSLQPGGRPVFARRFEERINRHGCRIAQACVSVVRSDFCEIHCHVETMNLDNGRQSSGLERC